METMINNILSAHEREDEATAASEEDFIRAVRREFANADDILAAAEAVGVTAADFVSGKAFLALRELPVRRTDGFYKQFVAYCGMTPAEYRKTLS